MAIPHDALCAAWRSAWGDEELPPPTEQRLVITLGLHAALRGERGPGGLLESADFALQRSFYFLFGAFMARVRAAVPALAGLEDAFRTFPDVV